MLLIAAVVAMVKIASADDQSTVIWGSITLALGVAFVMFVPIPFARVGFAFVTSFVGMIAYKMAADR
ncbi:MAG: hypothetical protein JWO31_740 [Phycisphaerales bacterium]|nr:hypothetical protein [Phycisphaerales bacterium]